MDWNGGMDYGMDYMYGILCTADNTISILCSTYRMHPLKALDIDH